MSAHRLILSVLIALPACAPAPSVVPAPVPAPLSQRAEGVMASLGYAQAIQVGSTIYVSGAVSRGANMEAQVAGAYASIARTLGPFGATLRDVVKETVYTTDMPALAAANSARKLAYGTHSPAATWVQISRLLMDQAMVEIEVIAVIGSAKPAP